MTYSDDLARSIESMEQSILTWRWETDGEAYVNAAYYAGKHDVYWDPDSHSVVEPPLRSDTEVRLPIPLATMIVQRLISRLLRDRKSWVVAPQTAEEAQRLAARGQQRMLTHLWEWQHLNRLCREEALPSVMLFGTGWLSPRWDPDAGRIRSMRVPAEPPREEPQRRPEEGEANVVQLFAGADIEPPGREEQVIEGEIVFRSPSYFDVICDPYAVRHEHLRYCIERSWVPVSDVKRAYSNTKDIRGSSGEPGSTWQQWMMSGLRQASSLFGGIFGGAGKGKIRGTDLLGDDEMVLLKKMWVAPSDRYPEGRLAVVANGQTLDLRDNPLGEIPLVPVPCFPIPGTAMRVPVMSLLRGPSLGIDRVISQFLMNIRAMGNPAYLAPRACNLDLNNLGDGIGQIWEYDPPPP